MAFDPKAPCRAAKRSKMEHKKQDALKQSSMEREAELKQKIKEAKVAVQFYKLKSENIEDEISELEQREEDLCSQIRKADADADAYRSEAEIFADKVELNFDDWLRMFGLAGAALFHQDEIPCGSDDDDVGMPTDAYYGCPGEEGDCDHALNIPQKDLSCCFGSSDSPIVSPSSRRLRSLLSISDAMRELPTDSPKGRCTAKRRKLQAKQHLNSVEIEAELRQELEEANKEAEFYKDKCDFGLSELVECRQRGNDLLQKLSKAKIRAEQYQREADLLGERFRDEWLREVVEGRPVVAAAAAESNPEEILCCSDTGYPTEVCRCCGDEEACMVVLPCNCLSLCMMCETETGTCLKCGSVKTGCFWTDMTN